MLQPKLPDLEDTIVAQSSAVGPGARAIVRLSGNKALAIAATLCPALSAKPGHYFSGQLHVSGFHSTVPADIYFFAAPHTYTGQDVVELHLISCQPIVEGLIADCLKHGARAAQPGEFTMRAFLAGKVDLTRAEAVLGVIEAGERDELKQALAQMAGGMAKPLQALRDDLLNLLADVEAGLDFADEDIHFVNTDDLLLRLTRGLAHLANLAKQLNQRSLGQRPFRVVLAGKPNAGKSSLFNALIGGGAALVSVEPGTTRDFLEQEIEAEGVRVELVDTAGQGESLSSIDLAAQDLAREQGRGAHLILWCVACDDRTIAQLPAGALGIATKADLAPAPPGMRATSATAGTGLADLRRLLGEQARSANHAPLAPSLSRCRHHLDACVQHLRQAHGLVLEADSPELLALQLRLALDELGAMTGAVYTDDLLDRVFSRFCIGK